MLLVIDDVVDATKPVTKNVDEVEAIGPVGDAGGDVMKQLPKNMQSNAKTAKNKGGTIYKDPDNPAVNNVRVQNGNPNSPNSAQQKPYVKQVKEGEQLL